MKVLIFVFSIILLATAELDPKILEDNTHDLASDAKNIHSFVTEMALDNIEEGQALFDAEMKLLKEKLPELGEKVKRPVNKVPFSAERERNEFVKDVKQKIKSTSLAVVRAVFKAARTCRGDADVILGRILNKKSVKRGEGVSCLNGNPENDNIKKMLRSLDTHIQNGFLKEERRFVVNLKEIMWKEHHIDIDQATKNDIEAMQESSGRRLDGVLERIELALGQIVVSAEYFDEHKKKIDREVRRAKQAMKIIDEDGRQQVAKKIRVVERDAENAYKEILEIVVKN